jgi:two-component system, sensor histidine kinase PhcS
MTLFEGAQKISALPQEKQQQFKQFFEQQIQHQIPLHIDLYLLLLFSLILIDIALKPSLSELGWLDYTRLALLSLLALAHRHTRLRTMRHLTVYALFLLNALYFHLPLIISGWTENPTGWTNNADAFFKLSLTLLSVGCTTFSLLHSSIIVVLHVLFLLASLTFSLPTEQAQALFVSLTTEWLVLFCLVYAILLVPLQRRIFRNIFAFKFILQEKNRLLADTLELLHTTEQQLAYQQKQRALSHMASGLLHEIINPVNCTLQALSYAQEVNAQEVNASPEVASTLKQVMTQQHHIASVVTELREFSLDRPNAEPQRVNLKNLIDQAIRLCHGELKAIDVRRNIPDGIDLTCHPNALMQVLINLMLNASDALHEHPSEPDAIIQIDAERTAEHVLINIRDNGKHRIETASLQSEPKPGRSALGLRICQTILRHHQGSLVLDSAPGSWTRACIQFPSERLSNQVAAT